MEPRPMPIAPGFVTGAALAGFFDGIVLHQILQWHHMICIEANCVVKSVAMMERQNLYDGLFHAAMLALLIGGLVWLTREVGRGRVLSIRRFWGSVLLGGGVFNVLEGIIDHHILQIHHVRFGPQGPAWDVGFLLLGLALAVVGFLIARAPRTEGIAPDLAADRG